MEFKIDPSAYGAMFPIPLSLVDENLRLASAFQLKAILYMFRRSMMGEQVTCAAIAKALGIDEEDVCDIMLFWAERGLVLKAGDEAKPAITQPEPEKQPVQEAAEKKAAQPEKQLERIPASKPSHEQVAIRCEECAQFRALFAEAQQKLGKTIGYEGQSTLIMLHDSYGLPIEVILMLLEYAKAKGKTGYQSLANLGRQWSENDIDTLEAAEEYIMEQTGTDALWNEFRSLSGVKNSNPTTKQRQYFSTWSKQYGFGADMIYKAYEISIENTEKMSLPYMEKVLKSWSEKGIITPDAVEKERADFSAKKRPKGTGKPAAQRSVPAKASYDIDAYMKKGIAPKYKK